MNSRSRHTLSALAGAALLLGPATTAWADDAATDPPVCPPGSITVVVDAVDVGGDVRVGCAEEATTGTEALTAAGFVDTRDEAGMVCAIDARPDPCPAEFTGEYWSYWYAEDGDWQMWLEGSDTAAVSPGGVEGWRYGDGSSGPSTGPDQLPSPSDVSEAGDGAGEPSAAGVAGLPDEGLPSWVLILAGVGLLGILATVVSRLTRRGHGHGPAGQD